MAEGQAGGTGMVGRGAGSGYAGVCGRSVSACPGRCADVSRISQPSLTSLTTITGTGVRKPEDAGSRTRSPIRWQGDCAASANDGDERVSNKGSRLWSLGQDFLPRRWIVHVRGGCLCVGREGSTIGEKFSGPI